MHGRRRRSRLVSVWPPGLPPWRKSCLFSLSVEVWSTKRRSLGLWKRQDVIGICIRRIFVTGKWYLTVWPTAGTVPPVIGIPGKEEDRHLLSDRAADFKLNTIIPGICTVEPTGVNSNVSDIADGSTCCCHNTSTTHPDVTPQHRRRHHLRSSTTGRN